MTLCDHVSWNGHYCVDFHVWALVNLVVEFIARLL